MRIFNKLMGCGLFCLAAICALLIFTGCTALADKAVGVAGGVDAVKIETTGSTSTGTLLPNITVGGAVSAIATAPSIENGKTSAPVFTMSRRNSFFGELFGIDSSTTAMAYIGTPGESAADTAKRVESLQKMLPGGKAKEGGGNPDTDTGAAETAAAGGGK